MNHAFLSKCLEQDNDEIDLSDEASTRPYASLEVTSAMKRIMVLCERSESRRSSNDRLIIPMKELSLDITSSSIRSTGRFKSPSNHAQAANAILVEWKQYQGYWSTEIGNELFDRVELLTEFLKTASRGSEILNLRLLNCLGYCHDDKKRRLGFIYAKPKSVGPGPCLRLSAVISKYGESDVYAPAVGDRMRLGRILCEAMFAFHNAEWFHKSFSSSIILLFPDTETSGEDSAGAPQASDYSIMAPYITGFNYSRPSQKDGFSEPDSISNEMRFYQHPSYKRVPMQKYTHEFDYYSLGIVLLEVGLWSPLATLTQSFNHQAPIEVANMIRSSLCPLLRSTIGSIFESVVVSLLEAFPSGTDQEEKNEYTAIGERLHFQTSVIQELSKCRA
jgi:hypothetical protein